MRFVLKLLIRQLSGQLSIAAQFPKGLLLERRRNDRSNSPQSKCHNASHMQTRTVSISRRTTQVSPALVARTRGIRLNNSRCAINKCGKYRYPRLWHPNNPLIPGSQFSAFLPVSWLNRGQPVATITSKPSDMGAGH